MEYYAAIKNKILPFSATWMDLEDIMPSGISQMGGGMVYNITYMQNFQKVQHTGEYNKETDLQR